MNRAYGTRSIEFSTWLMKYSLLDHKYTTMTVSEGVSLLFQWNPPADGSSFQRSISLTVSPWHQSNLASRGCPRILAPLFGSDNFRLLSDPNDKEIFARAKPTYPHLVFPRHCALSSEAIFTVSVLFWCPLPRKGCAVV